MNNLPTNHQLELPSSASCTALDALQIVAGVLLLIAAVFGYPALQSNIVLVPGIMGLILLSSGCRSWFIQRQIFKLRNVLR